MKTGFLDAMLNTHFCARTNAGTGGKKNPQGNCAGLCSEAVYHSNNNTCAVHNDTIGQLCADKSNKMDKRAKCGERKGKTGMRCLSPVLDAIQYCDALYII